MNRYNPKSIEEKWQKDWQKKQIYAAEDFSDKPKYYLLTEFPYPSGDGLHMGHAREYTLGDVLARYKRTQGHNVLYPMGYDAFGLPTENYAIKHQIAPQIATERNIANFQKQFESFGLSIDWSRKINTTDPNYYKWTQWLFLQFYKQGLAYQDDIEINWCPKCKTGLANEEVIDGRHERCDTVVEKRKLKQWVLKITEYADKLIDNLADLDFPAKIADQQINWIGRSYGAEIDFKIDAHEQKITVFTTRPDTLFGVSFIVLAPEHPLVAEIVSDQQRAAAMEYVESSRVKTDIERQDQTKEKTGVPLGAFAVHPLTGEKLPIWISDYVMLGYGTGAIMAVPAHDERDHEFAKKFDLPIKQVIMPSVVDQLNPPRDEFEMVKRPTVIVHVRDKSTGKYAVLHWHNTLEGVVTAIMGGVEDGQTPAEAALAEIAEEAGLKAAIVKELPWVTMAEYCASHKKQNRRAITHGFLAEVENAADAQKVDEYETKTHTLKWVGEDRVLETLTPEHQKLVWTMLKDGGCWSGEGQLINSGAFDGLSSEEAKKQITSKLESLACGAKKVNYHLRDWIFSRQHYWGEPIPIIHCPKCGVVPVPEKDLPVTLPEVDHYEPTDDGESPLSKIDSWVNVDCPICGAKSQRETDTMPNWAGSSWYFLRYTDANNDEKFADFEKMKYWGPVDLYLGGMEHTTLHLLYSRFWHEFLYDQGLVPTPEPYQARRAQGIVLAADGSKMSKSKGNVVNPTDIIDSGYGADAMRLTIAFMAPYDLTTAWQTNSVPGMYRFLNRVWNLTQEHLTSEAVSQVPDQLIHKTIAKVTDDLEGMHFNTAIAALMELTNELYKLKTAGVAGESWQFAIKTLLQLLAPFAPHIAEELWHQLGETETIHLAVWPKVDESKLSSNEITLAVQVNGRVRGEITVPSDAEQSTVLETAKTQPNVQKHINGKTLVKEIYVPGRLVSLVVK